MEAFLIGTAMKLDELNIFAGAIEEQKKSENNDKGCLSRCMG